MRGIAWIILVLGVLGTLFCGYSFLFSAWVTATPLTPPQLVRAQYNANAWLALTALSLVVSILAVVFIVRQCRKVTRGFDVLPDGGPAAG